MRAILRGIAVLLAGTLCVAPTNALAQTATAPAAPPTTNTPVTETIGPSELQNFNLKGTVTRPADQPAASAPARPQAAPVQQPRLAAPPSRPPQARVADRTAPSTTTSARPSTTAIPSPAPQNTPPPTATVPVAQAPTPLPAPATGVASEPVTPPADPFAIFRGLSLLPWIAVVIALALGASLVLWRRRPRGYAMAGSQFDLLPPPPAPDPEPEPRPLPRAATPTPSAPPLPPKPAAPAGIVASRLRPALEIGFHPLRCQVDDDQVAIEFELELFNAGTAPARAVLAEASMLNAGASQDDDLAAFYSNPNGVGERLSVIPPMKRVSFRSQVVAPRAAVQEYELAGRKSFVPVIAFNALYEWSGGNAQSSAAYLVGRDTQRDKLGPLRLDQGAREFSALGARPLPSAVRT